MLKRTDPIIASVLAFVAVGGVDVSQIRPVADADARLRVERRICRETGASPDEARAHVREILGL